MTVEYFKYVALSAIGTYLSAGWTIVDDMATCHHGFYSVLMRYEGEGEPCVKCLSDSAAPKEPEKPLQPEN